MTTFKMITFAAILISAHAYAGGSGGGGVLGQAWVIQDNSYVYNMGQKNGQTKFKMGQWTTQGAWQTKDFSVWDGTISSAISGALMDSAVSRNWAQISN